MEAPAYFLSGSGGDAAALDAGAGGSDSSGGAGGIAATGGAVGAGGTSASGGAAGQAAGGASGVAGESGSGTGGSGAGATGGSSTSGAGGFGGGGGSGQTSTGGSGGFSSGGSGGQMSTGGSGGSVAGTGGSIPGTGGSSAGGAAGRASTGGAGGSGAGGSGGAAGSGATGGAGGLSLPPLFAYYPFDQTAGPTIPDGSGNGHAGTLEGTATFPAGVIGNCLDLPGTSGDYVALPSALLQTLTSVTITVWVNVQTDHNWQRVFDFGSSTNVYMFFTPHNGTSNVARFAITTSGNSSTSEQRLDAAGILPVGTWTHVAVVLGSSGGTLYINGAAVATNTALTLRPADLGATTNDWLGRSQFTADPAFDGQIDDLRIYASALSAAQITTIYTGR